MKGIDEPQAQQLVHLNSQRMLARHGQTTLAYQAIQRKDPVRIQARPRADLSKVGYACLLTEY